MIFAPKLQKLELILQAAYNFQLMKLFIFLLLANFSFCYLSSQTTVNEQDLPSEVKRFFPSVYNLNDSIIVKWEKNDSIYIAKFTDFGNAVEIHFKSNGYWLITYFDIDFIQTPESIKNKLKKITPYSKIYRSAFSTNIFDQKYYHFWYYSKRNKLKHVKFNLQAEVIKDN